MTIMGAVVLMMGCGTIFKPKDRSSEAPLTVAEKFDLYKGLSIDHPSRDGYGMFLAEGSRGDSALFSCLHQFATGEQVDILSSFSDEGLPLRHPEITKADAATPISRDMLMGFMMCAISSTNGSEIMTKLIQAGVDNGWDLCGPAPEFEIDPIDRIGRCVVSPGLIGTMYRVRTYLGVDCNAGCQAAQQIPTGIARNVDGFRRHLSALHVIVRGFTGGLDDGELDVLRHHAEQQPNNALYQAAYHKFLDGDQSKATALLLDTTKFPEYTLPTSANYCTHYLYQRDESSQHDWLPCDEGLTHIGIDFLLAGRLAL
jgi:hypothetical protein